MSFTGCVPARPTAAVKVNMLDLLFLALATAFFGAAVAYVKACDAISGAKHD
jgi:hypothetical protein